MKRKVIQIANSTQLVSLPRKWALLHGIKKGDELEVEERGNRLIVSTSNILHVEKISLQLSSSDEYLRRNLDVLYRYGYDEIDIKFNDPHVIELISETVEDLLGFEVVNQGKNYCTVKNIVAGLETELENILRRVFLMILSMTDDTYNSLKTNDFKTLSKITHFDRTINKFTNFCERLLNKKGFKDPKKTTFVYYIVCTLEQLSDEYKDLLSYVCNNDLKLSKKILDLYKRTNDLFNSLYKLFYNFERKHIFTIKQKRVSLQKDLLSHIASKTGKEAVVSQHLFSVVSFIQHMSTRII